MESSVRTLKTLSDWKEELRALRSVKAAHIGRDASDARAWLVRDAERCEAKASRMVKTADAIEAAPNLVGNRTGKTVETINLRRRAKKLFAEAALTRDAASRVHLSPKEIESRIDAALSMVGDLTREAADKRASRQKKVRP